MPIGHTQSELPSWPRSASAWGLVSGWSLLVPHPHHSTVVPPWLQVPVAASSSLSGLHALWVCQASTVATISHRPLHGRERFPGLESRVHVKGEFFYRDLPTGAASSFLEASSKRGLFTGAAFRIGRHPFDRSIGARRQKTLFPGRPPSAHQRRHEPDANNQERNHVREQPRYSSQVERDRRNVAYAQKNPRRYP